MQRAPTSQPAQRSSSPTFSLTPFRRRLEADQRVVPESIEPEPEHRQAVRLNGVEVPRAALRARDEARTFEDLQMLRHGGSADRHRVRDRPDGGRAALTNELEHPAPGGITERI